jgi:hypothetical protein
LTVRSVFIGSWYTAARKAKAVCRNCVTVLTCVGYTARHTCKVCHCVGHYLWLCTSLFVALYVTICGSVRHYLWHCASLFVALCVTISGTDVFVAQLDTVTSKFLRGRNGALAFASIHQQPLPLPHLWGVSQAGTCFSVLGLHWKLTTLRCVKWVSCNCYDRGKLTYWTAL